MKFLLLVAVLFASPVLSQEGQRGSTPPGQSRDGAAPADGAIKGGTILPGESGGQPDKMEKRCKQLSGSLREECLERQRAASGATSDTRKRSPVPAD